MKAGGYELPYVDVGHDIDEADWIVPYEMELFGAPLTRYRDQADTTAQIIIYLEMYIDAGVKERQQRRGAGIAA